ncbi:ribbon-helix-helix protein, CopG family [Glycomyces paridis]|uniref:Ribbon-helix-helix protein, CopG family n=1 Tax=Glycomyces paridis TaxID=2126555 RepID=A0A4S8PCT1_9ACTN|nr:ribbon-helix-helix protein, CopG family [Glycomyces paridis]THV27591.1 ribbon-helix-helix protein, CopG family [Glycomyces paridis]
MAKKRTMVYADEEDLAIIKEAAKRYGVSEAEIIRNAIHRAAMSSRIWEEPFFTRTSKRLVERDETFSEAREAVWDEQYEKYRRMRDER